MQKAQSKSVLLYFLTLPFFAFAQPPTGLELSPEQYGNVPLLHDFKYGAKADDQELDLVDMVDLKPYCPTPGDQGNTQSCVGWSSAFGAYTIQTAIRNDWRGKQSIIDQFAYSAFFPYNLASQYSCRPVPFPPVLDKLTEVGDVKRSEYDYHGSCTIEPDANLLKKASDNRLKAYLRLFAPYAPASDKVRSVKKSLINQRPVLIGMHIRNNFWDKISPGGYWRPHMGDEDDRTSLGGHAMVVVGFKNYDDGNGGYFEIMNSWGTSWGQNGFFKITYEDFAEFCMEAFQLVMFDSYGSPEAPLFPAMEANIRVRFPVFIPKKGDPIFEDAPVVYTDDIYKVDKVWERNSKIQFWITEATQQPYLYVFSVDPEGTFRLHWPRDQELDDKYDGPIVSPIIVDPNAILILPEKKRVFLQDKPGTDHLIMLFAQEPIPDFNERKDKFMAMEGSYEDRLSVFGKLAKNVKFSSTEIEFYGELDGDEVVPVVIQMLVE